MGNTGNPEHCVCSDNCLFYLIITLVTTCINRTAHYITLPYKKCFICKCNGEEYTIMHCYCSSDKFKFLIFSEITFVFHENDFKTLQNYTYIKVCNIYRDDRNTFSLLEKYLLEKYKNSYRKVMKVAFLLTSKSKNFNKAFNFRVNQ